MSYSVRSGNIDFSCLEAKQVRDLHVNRTTVIDEAVVTHEAGVRRDCKRIEILEIAVVAEIDCRTGMIR